jgi:hypothetical protein
MRVAAKPGMSELAATCHGPTFAYTIPVRLHFLLGDLLFRSWLVVATVFLTDPSLEFCLGHSLRGVILGIVLVVSHFPFHLFSARLR